MPCAEKHWTDAYEIIQRGDGGRLFVSESRMSSSDACLRQISLALGAPTSDIEQSTCALASATDNQLLAHVAEGRQEALGHLFDRYVRLVRSIASRILRDTSQAEDLAQDFFLFIQRKCGIFDSSKSPA